MEAYGFKIYGNDIYIYIYIHTYIYMNIYIYISYNGYRVFPGGKAAGVWR